jgi:tRNA-splicing ligase RtcB
LRIGLIGAGSVGGLIVDSAVPDKAQDGWSLEATCSLYQKAAAQLGTVGSGNHYVDLFTDEDDRVWIGVHFGSRGFGHGVVTWFLKAAGAKDGMDVEPCVLDVNSDLGAQYLLAMSLAGAYAYAGRDWVCDRVAKILGAEIVEVIHNYHNFAWHEKHGDEMFWVVRKGATPAFPGEKGFVDGSMGEQSVILEGVENEDAKYSLYSTVHGAGRSMGRKEATGVYDRKTGECKREGRVTQAMMRSWIDRSGIGLRGGGLDESTDCYGWS